MQKVRTTLNGQKMSISNGGFADLLIGLPRSVAKTERFYRWRRRSGLQPGNEEHEMGIHGSSTTPVFLEKCKVPKEDLLHEIGRGQSWRLPC